MILDDLINPLAHPSRLYLRMEGEASGLTQSGRDFQQSVNGEIRLALAGPLRADEPTEASVERLTLFSTAPLEGRAGDSGLQEISLLASSRRGRWAPVPEAKNRWHLEADLVARLFTADRAQPPDAVSCRDVSQAESNPFQTLTGTLEVSVSVDGPLPAQNRVESYELTLRSRDAESLVGMLRLTSREDFQTPGPRLAFTDRDRSVVHCLPLLPVFFGPHGHQTGGDWTNLLQEANRVWDPCKIIFFNDSVVELMEIPRNASTHEIGKKVKEPDRIEVFFIPDAGDHGAGSVTSCGRKSAQVFLWQDPKKHLLPALLAHELVHVMGGCHPSGNSGCSTCCWHGESGGISEDSGWPASTTALPKDCDGALTGPQPLLQATHTKVWNLPTPH